MLDCQPWLNWTKARQFISEIGDHSLATHMDSEWKYKKYSGPNSRKMLADFYALSKSPIWNSWIFHWTSHNWFRSSTSKSFTPILHKMIGHFSSLISNVTKLPVDGAEGNTYTEKLWYWNQVVYQGKSFKARLSSLLFFFHANMFIFPFPYHWEIKGKMTMLSSLSTDQSSIQPTFRLLWWKPTIFWFWLGKKKLYHGNE